MERTEHATSSQKMALRERFRSYRAGLSEAAHAASSAALVAQLQTLPELTHAEVVHTYWPLLARREVDLRPLIHKLQADGKTIVLPVVVFGAASPHLRHVCLEDAGSLRPNQWGIPEPTGHKSVPIEDIDVVIVPALGAGRNGHRLGYGKGFYDAFLDTLHAPTLCPIYRPCLVPWISPEAHDVPLDVLLTEDEIIRP